MSLNSFVTPEGGEIGRAQALQAEACGLTPHVDMNPILLKPESDNCSQVIVRGKVFNKQAAAAYLSHTQQLWSVVKESYTNLASQYDVVMIEGAGSAAEVNRMDWSGGPISMEYLMSRDFAGSGSIVFVNERVFSPLRVVPRSQSLLDFTGNWIDGRIMCSVMSMYHSS
jgi:hypothetical protein